MRMRKPQIQPPANWRAPTTPAPTVNGERALQYVKEIVAFGARPIGSANHKKLENYIASHLKGDEVEDRRVRRGYAGGQASGAEHHREISGNEGWDHRDRRALRHELPAAEHGVCGSERWWIVDRDAAGAREPIAGQDAATDTASGWSGPMARKRSKNGPITDSVYGTRHLAAKWQKDGTIKKIKAFLLADMIGDCGSEH